MEVTCQKCLTKYYLDDSRLTSAQAKVRCSRCQHVFTVSLGLPTEEVVSDSQPERPVGGLTEDAAMEEAAGREEAGQLLSWLSQEDKGEAEERPAAAVGGETEEVAVAPPAAEVAEPVAVPESFGAPGRRWYIWALAGVAAFLGLAGGGVWFYKSKTSPRAPLVQEKQAPVSESEGAAASGAAAMGLDGLMIETQEARYRGLVNKTAGQLLVVQGKVKNTGSQVRGPVKLKLILVDGKHQPVSQGEFFSGSSFTDEELLTRPAEELRRWLGTPGGRSQKPFIGPGETQGFTGILMGVPGDLAEKGYGYNLLIVQGPVGGKL